MRSWGIPLWEQFSSECPSYYAVWWVWTWHFYPSTLWAWGVLSYWSGWSGGCQVGCCDFAEWIFLKPLDGFSLFEVLWNWLDPKLCIVMVFCSFASYGLAHEPKTCQIWYHWGPDFVEFTFPKRLDRFTPFRVLWNCATSWAYDHDLGFSRSSFEKAVSKE